jgi:LuxR family maltose regulon positive regulatory protein
MLGAKVAVPRLPRTFLSRPRLRAALDRAGGDPVTVVCAPAGYGKTALLAEWATSPRRADIAWVSLDGDDNDERRFWAAVLSALDRCATIPGDSAVHGMQPPTADTRTDFLAELADAMDVLPTPVRLVLDDFHEIVRPEPLQGVATLIRHHPRGLRLVLVTRFDPHLRLTRLHLQGDLTRIGTDELRFTAEETMSLLHTAGVVLDDHRVQQLTERTAGWAAALRWAAASMAGTDDIDRFLTEFDGDDRAIAGFLADEVLARLPEGTATLLGRISVCDSVTATLATRLSGRDDAGAALDDLERHTSLVTRVDDGRESYRMHPLLRTYLRADLSRRQPDQVAALHRVAAQWLAGENRVTEALAHAVAGRSRAELVNLLQDKAIPLLLAGDQEAVRDALSYLDEEAIHHDPHLVLVSALDHIHNGELTASAADLDRWAGHARGREAQRLLGWLMVRHQALAVGQRPAGTSAPRGARSPTLGTWAELDRAWSSLHRGARRHAVARATAALSTARHHGLDYLVVHGLRALASAKGIDGDYSVMRAACAEAIAIGRRHGWRRSPWLADCHLMLAYDHLLQADPAAAVQELASAGRAIVPGSAPLLDPVKNFLGGVARFDSGDWLAGVQAMRLARFLLADLDMPRELAAALAVLEHRAALSLGEMLHAGEVQSWARDRLGGTAELALLRTWACLAAEQPGQAAAALRDVQDGSHRVLLPTTLVDASLVDTALGLRAGRRTTALQALDRALALARPTGVTRSFALAEPQVRHLLIEQSGGFGALDDFARSVRSRIATHGQRAVADGLTERERVVLQRLPSPRSLDEIAMDLTVSVNTVKTHVRGIYSKLGVNNRRSAVVVAREYGIA